jgi:hypothetical protein
MVAMMESGGRLPACRRLLRPSRPDPTVSALR